MIRKAFLIPLILLPFSVSAEGARMVLSCVATAQCDATGACDTSADPRGYVVSPVSIDDAGAGIYNVSYDAETYAAKGMDRTGPFRWMVGDYQQFTLSLTGERSALFVLQDLTPNGTVPPTARVEFLSCEVSL